MQLLLDKKWFQGACLLFFFACIAIFAYTGKYLYLAPPFGLLYFLLLGANWKTAYWILLFIIPASMQFSYSDNAFSASLPDEPMMWLMFLLFLLMLAKQPTLVPRWFWANPLVLIIVLQLLWLIVAVAFSTVFFLSLKFLIAKVWYLVVYLVMPIWIFRDKKDFRKGFVVMLVPLIITMIIIMYRHWKLHFAFSLIQHAIGDLYYNHVDYSTVLSMFFPVICIVFGSVKSKYWWLKWTLFFIIVFFLVAIFFSYARAAVIAIVFAAIIGIAIRLKLVNWVMPLFYALIIVLIAYMVHDNKYIDFRPNYAQTYMHKNFTDHIISTFRGEDMSSMERLYRWIAAIRMSKVRPITGYGPHGFVYNYKPYAVSVFRTYVSRNDEHSTTHNYFLYMLVEQGWPAMLLYAVLVFAFFAQAQRIYFRLNDRFYKNVVLSVATMFAAAFINNFFSELIETHKVGALFYLCIAALVVLDKKSRDMQAEMETKPAITA